MTDTVIKHITELLRKKERVIVAVDGRCAAGKTTFAKKLKEKIDCTVLHTDDYFPQPYQRGENRLENIDKERFLSQVLRPLKESGTFTYQPYNCKEQKLKEALFLKSEKVTVIEGSYSCCDAFRSYTDLCIFLSCDKETQKKRLLERNGQSGAQMFFLKWIPLEERYFSTCQIPKHCDLYFET